MDSRNVTPEVFSRQAEHPPENSGEIHPRRKVGVEIVRSANLASRFFHGPRRQRHVFTWNDNDAWAWRVAAATR